MKSLKPRLLTAVVGIPLVLIVLFLSEMWHPFASIIIGLASALMICEYLYAKKLMSNLAITIPCALFTFGMSTLIATKYLLLLLLLYVIVMFAVMIAQHSKIQYLDIAYAMFGTLLISFGMSSMSYVFAGGFAISFYFIIAFALPWMADAGGFFIGASFGKHKLCPNVSPKKTVEGALGGILFCILSAIIIGIIFHFWIIPDFNINFWALIIVGAIDAPLSILGDLSFSLIKRNLNIKDYGSIFPGHGGMLDRFDSIIFTAPVIIVVNQFLPLLTI